MGEEADRFSWGSQSKPEREKPMKRFRTVLFAGALCSVGLLLHTATVASAAVAYVSKDGTATTGCTASNPCRQIQDAIVATGTGGHVQLLTGGDFNPFTVDRAVTVRGHTDANVTATSGTAIVVSPPVAGDMVTLTRLHLYGGGVATTGINFTNGILLLKRFHLDGFTTNAINATSPGYLQYKVGSVHGLTSSSNGGSISLSGVGQENIIANVDFSADANLGAFVLVKSGAYATLRTCTMNTKSKPNPSTGVKGTDSGTRVSIFNSDIHMLTFGISSYNSAVVKLFNNEVTMNANGLTVGTGGTICCYGLNRIVDNDFSNTCNLCSPGTQ
jgi:hypothetical protein